MFRKLLRTSCGSGVAQDFLMRAETGAMERGVHLYGLSPSPPRIHSSTRDSERDGYSMHDHGNGKLTGNSVSRIQAVVIFVGIKVPQVCFA